MCYDGGMDLKIVTLNLYRGGEFFDKIVDFLRAEDADIVLLQEACNGTGQSLARQFRTLEELRKVLAYPADDFAPAHLELEYAHGKAQIGNLVLSKLPISKRQVIFYHTPYSDTFNGALAGNYQDEPRVLQYVELKTSSGPLHVFNLHGAWNLNGDEYSLPRQRMADAVINATKDKKRVIVAGDINTRPTNQAIRRIQTEANLTNIFADELKSTFNTRHKTNPGYASSIVDMVFVSPDVEVLAHACPDVDVSDHMPLAATLRI